MSDVKKFELTDQQHPSAPWLHRIRALVDIPRAGVKAGDLGGWVESEACLAHSGAAWVSGAAQVYGADHTLTAGPLSSEGHHGTLTRQTEGQHQIIIGCWAGTVDDLRRLAASDHWPSGCSAEVRARYAPRLLAFAALCEIQIGLWEPAEAVTSGE